MIISKGELTGHALVYYFVYLFSYFLNFLI